MPAAVRLALAVLLVARLAPAQDATTTTTFPLLTTTTAESTTTTSILPPTTTTAAPTTTTSPPTTTVPATTSTTTASPTSTTLVPPTTTIPLPSTTTTLPPTPGPCPAGACDDGDPCTIDGCDPIKGCVHEPATGVPCDDGDPCTTTDACLDGACVGVPVVCDDRVDCTVDRCVAGRCVATPSDARCDTGECVVRACLPGTAGADRAGCVSVPGARDGIACTDDGFTCTDDVCLAGRCLHPPVHGRCAAPDACTTAACMPGLPAADAAGCIAGEPLPDGASCPDDGDVCTDDVCAGGDCRHDPVASATCEPVQDVFQVATALASEARSLQGTAREAGAVGEVIALRLDPVEQAFSAAARALAGEVGPSPAVAGAGAVAAADTEMTAAQRARIAFTTVLRTPRQVSTFLQTVAAARARAGLSQPLARHLRQRGRVLRRTARFLKSELRDIGRSAP